MGKPYNGGDAGRAGLGDVAAAALLVAAAATMPRSSSATSPADRGVAGRGAPAVEGSGVPAPRRPTPATSKSGVLGKLDLALQRHRVTAFPVAVIRKFGDDRGGRLAALIAYYGFFSVFPAMLALVTVLGFMLENDPDLRADIANSAFSQFPVVGDSIASSVTGPLTGNPIALAIGLGGALWAGMGAVQACQDAMNEVWEVERVRYPSFLMKRLRSLLMLLLLGIMLATSTALTQLVQVFDLGPVTVALVFLAALVVDIAMFAVAYRVLTVASPTWRQVFPGAAFAGTAYVILQTAGGLYIAHTVNGASDTYGTFAVVIGLLTWIFLIAQVLVLGAEVNTVVIGRLWPRSLFAEAATDSDKRSQAAQATSQRMDHAMDVDVDFDPATDPAADPAADRHRSGAAT